jgi:hypothetical protein
MDNKETLVVALRALIAEFRAPENRDWLTSACADRLEVVLTLERIHPQRVIATDTVTGVQRRWLNSRN